MDDLGWDIGMTQDNRTNSAGICVRRRFQQEGKRFEWASGATAAEIAAQLRNAVLFLEVMSDHTVSPVLLRRLNTIQEQKLIKDRQKTADLIERLRRVERAARYLRNSNAWVGDTDGIEANLMELDTALEEINDEPT